MHFDPRTCAVDLHLPSTGSQETLALASEQAIASGAKLECALYCSTNAVVELKTLLSWLTTTTPIGRWLLFDDQAKTTPSHLIELAREVLAPVVPGVPIGGGSNAYFTELNRDRTELAGADIVCYSLNPQVHAFDNTSLIENALAIAATVESARQLYPEKAIAVTPVTLKPRFNPDATGAAAQGQSNRLPDNVDPRQMSLFGAAWTLAAIQSLAASGAASATFYETLGWCGVIERDEGSPLQGLFRSIPGGVFPVYFVVAALGESKSGVILRTRIGHPLSVSCIAAENSGRRRVMLANLTPNRQRISLRGLSGECRLRRLDETNVEHAMREPDRFFADNGDVIRPNDGSASLSLLPYAIAIVDF